MAEHFDESLLLLGARMGWPLQDLLDRFFPPLRLRRGEQASWQGGGTRLVVVQVVEGLGALIKVGC